MGTATGALPLGLDVDGCVSLPLLSFKVGVGGEVCLVLVGVGPNRSKMSSSAVPVALVNGCSAVSSTGTLVELRGGVHANGSPPKGSWPPDEPCIAAATAPYCTSMLPRLLVARTL